MVQSRLEHGFGSCEEATDDKPSVLRKLSFVLPAGGRSGGVRVTVDLANELLKRGHQVRLIYRRPSLRSLSGLRKRTVEAFRRLWYRHTDWLPSFSGETIPLPLEKDLTEVAFAQGEFVIAVGSMTIYDVATLGSDVIKLRYCHGFSEHQSEIMWRIQMPTIAVSPMLLKRLDEFGCHVVATIPNAIDDRIYFDESKRRQGVGMIYSENPKKAPEETLRLVRHINEQFPDLPIRIVSDRPNPGSFPKSVEYHRYPSVDQMRQLYNDCKVWLVTSRSEGFCLPILEAMSCGCAVISSDHDTARGLITHGSNGEVVPFADNVAFFNRILRMESDEPLRRKYVENGKLTSRSYTWESSALAFERVLAQLAIMEPLPG